MIKVERALISVSDKTGLVEFGKALAERGVEILSTGGTLKALNDAGIAAKPVESYTEFPEMMDGRLKTLHPKIHGGLLALEDRPEHVNSMKEHGIQGIDLLVVNLYPFAATIVKKDTDLATAIENIDIGGPTMLRAAAKNYRFTASVCNVGDYEKIIKAMDDQGGIDEKFSLELSRAVFNHTASYDALIAGYLNEHSGDEYPDTLTMSFAKVQNLRYGENPHQQAGFYRPVLDLARESSNGGASFE